MQYIPVQEEVQYVPISHSQEEEKGNLSQDSQTNDLQISEIMEEIINPILFTEHLTLIGRIPMSKSILYQVTLILL